MSILWTPYIPDGDEFHFVPDGEAYHSAELWYVFGTLNRCWRHFDGRHYDLSYDIIKYWTNFAKTGNPNGKGLPAWEPVTEESRTRMVFNEKGICPEDIKHMDVLEKELFK